MQQSIKRLGELLVESGLITPVQLQGAITHQKIAKGRLGTNLVALGYITEEILMDFLSHQAGVPQMDVRNHYIPPQILKLVPYRLADQFTMLPIAIKEPKSLVLAMSDPSDLNAIDSARFASGLNIQPVVASHSAMRQAIGDLYRHIEGPAPASRTVEVGAGTPQDDALPFTFILQPQQVSHPPALVTDSAFPRDPFFGSDSAPTQPVNSNPFGFFETARPSTTPSDGSADLIHGRTIEDPVRRLETYQTRTLVLALIRIFQRRGIMGDDELQRLLANLVETGEIKDNDKIG